MKLFVDTANIEQIRTAWSWGILDGVTTNPTHIAATGREFDDVLREIFSLVNGPISVETVSTEAEGIITEGRAIAALHPNAVVKVVVTIEGLKAVKVLAEEGIKTNVTLCFSPLQGYLAAKAGATYISPFVHRLDIYGHEGIELVHNIRAIYDTYGYETEIIAASIRSPKQVLDCLMAGADVATMPFDIMQALYLHPMTDQGIQMFMNDWKKVPPSKLFEATAGKRGA